MEQHLQQHAFFPRQSMTLADIALVAYTRLAPEGGFTLDGYHALASWITRVELALRLK
jgi:glutathione S-transferase